ncbi:MHS family proline/betaine transporter-like MFS transporter [Arthrobacter sp. B2I5]|uniref:MFS transporter n=1 Tax=Arthrobacter sp. B2I5 TaxID=3042266 RepID=UPI002783617E|nr:MFS transporter [Arthrobacter sp. B2I5]MDQ0824142.1 MHS family proline/betaine transporter-like MFS transporter [Arthrobacter sp. B2I5]
MSDNKTPDTDLLAAPAARRRIFASTMLGNVVEYYDFTLYGTLAAIIATQFFPSGDPTVALLAVYVGVVLSYAIRPLGGIILGPLGDIKGRKFVLILTIALMSIGTAGIGFLPTYAAIGVTAPVLLLLSRLLQGIGASVEYTTAANFLFEHERGRRPNFIAGVLNSTASVGSFLAAGLAYVLSVAMPGDVFTSWGWRIPFLLSIPIALIGVYMRNHLSETPEFQEVVRTVAAEKVKQTPLRTALRLYWRDMLKAIGLGAGQRIGSYTIQAYFVTALITAGFPASQALLASMLTYLVGPITSIWGGQLSDKYGARRVLLTGYGLFVALTVPAFYAISNKSILLATAAVIVFTLINNLVAAPLSVAYVLSFPPEVRATAAALNFNIGTSVIGATAGLVAVWLFSVTGSNVSFGWYTTAACVVSICVAIFALPAALHRVPPAKTEVAVTA